MTNYIIAANICFFLSGLCFGIGAGYWYKRAIVDRAKGEVAKMRDHLNFANIQLEAAQVANKALSDELLARPIVADESGQPETEFKVEVPKRRRRSS